MATRLFSDLKDSAGRRYFFDLDSSPGVLLPGVATLTLRGNVPLYPGTVFRTPATAALTLNGLPFVPDVILSPATAALASANSTVGQLGLHLTIRPSLESPLENPPAPFAPTILFINTITPAPAALSVIGYNHSLSEGGNIGFLRPPLAALTLTGYQYTRVIPPAPPEEGVDGQLGTATLEGLAPSLVTQVRIEPDVGSVAVGALVPVADKGFIWIDDDPAPPLSWS